MGQGVYTCANTPEGAGFRCAVFLLSLTSFDYNEFNTFGNVHANSVADKRMAGMRTKLTTNYTIPHNPLPPRVVP